MIRSKTTRPLTFLLFLPLLGDGSGGALYAQMAATPLFPNLQQSSEGSRSDEGALFLLLPVGAQGVAMARAMTAIPSAEGAFWNPAGLARIERSRISVYRGDHIAGEALGFTGLLARQGVGAVGLSYNLLDIGTQDLTDETGQVLGSITVRGHQGIASAAALLEEAFGFGVNLKLVQFNQSCRGQCPDGGVSATTYAVDLGLHLRPLAGRPLEIGAMLAHLGPDLQVENVEQADPLPSRFRIGVSYDLYTGLIADEEIRFRLTGEVDDRLRSPGSPSIYFASEFTAGSTDQIYLRGGYIVGNRNETDGAALGLGFRYERFDFGLARSLAREGPSPDQEPVHLTLGISF